MGSKKIYVVVGIIASFLIVINLFLLLEVRDYQSGKMDLVEQKMELLLLGHEFQNTLESLDGYFEEAYYRNHKADVDSIIQLNNVFNGEAPRSESLKIHPGEAISFKQLWHDAAVSSYHKESIEESLRAYHEYESWILNQLRSVDSVPVSDRIVLDKSDRKDRVQQSIQNMVSLGMRMVTQKQHESEYVSSRFTRLVIVILASSILFFLLAIIFVFRRLMQPYFESRDKLEDMDQKMWRAASIVFWEFDLQNECYKGGRPLANFFGYNLNAIELPRTDIMQLTKNAGETEIWETAKRNIGNRKRKGDYEMRFIDRFGNSRIAKVMAEYHYDEEGTLIKEHGVIQDVTSQKKTELDLELSQERLDDILHKLEVGMAEMSPSKTLEGEADLTFTKVNNAFCKIFNLSYSQIQGKTFYEAFPHVKHSWIRFLSTEFNNEASTLFRLFYDKNAGKWINIKVYKETEDKYIVFVEDVTRDQELKQELRQNQERLTLSEQMAGLGYVNIDRKNRLVYGNQNAYDIHGISSMVEIKFKRYLSHVLPEDRQIFVDSLQKLAHQDKVEMVYRVKADDKLRYIHCVLESTSVRDQQFEVFGFVHDITTVKQVELELRKAKDKAEESERLKSAFLANMSHEIRTPLSAIVGFAGILAKNKEISDTEREECNTLIEKNSNALMVLINDVVELSKIESGEITMIPAVIEMNSLLDDVHQVFTQEIARNGKNHLRLFINKSIESGLNIQVDAHRLTQVVNNLVSNAIKFTSKGFVEIGYELNGTNDLVMYVRDSGIGIDKKNQDLIFDVFRQEDFSVAGQFGGTGLGLAISKKIIELMEGKIWVESTKGVGSTFFISIPLQKAKEKKAGKVEPVKALQDFNFKGKTILVADDEEFVHVLFRNYISPTGAKVVDAYDGEQALELMNNGNKVDLVLLDMRMPKLNGIQTVTKMRERHMNTPVIAQTAYAFTGDKERFVEAGCNAYLSKPVDEVELLKTISKFLS